MDWLRYGAEHYPNRICINEYTYNDIYRGVVYVARKLEPLKATRIAILFLRNEDFVTEWRTGE